MPLRVAASAALARLLLPHQRGPGRVSHLEVPVLRRPGRPPLALAVRVPRNGSCGRRLGQVDVAQLVEHRTQDPGVAGSTPASPIAFPSRSFGLRATSKRVSDLAPGCPRRRGPRSPRMARGPRTDGTALQPGGRGRRRLAGAPARARVHAPLASVGRAPGAGRGGDEPPTAPGSAEEAGRGPTGEVRHALPSTARSRARAHTNTSLRAPCAGPTAASLQESIGQGNAP